MVNANDLQDYYPTHSYSESGKYLEAPNKTIIDQVPDNYFIDKDGKSIFCTCMTEQVDTVARRGRPRPVERLFSGPRMGPHRVGPY